MSENNYTSESPTTSVTDSNSYTPKSITGVKVIHEHEQKLQEEKNKHELALKELDQLHKKELKQLQLGRIGKYFGGKKMVALNISAILLLLFLIIGLVFTCLIFKKHTIITVAELWAIITPIITLILGYIFGSKTE